MDLRLMVSIDPTTLTGTDLAPTSEEWTAWLVSLPPHPYVDGLRPIAAMLDHGHALAREWAEPGDPAFPLPATLPEDAPLDTPPVPLDPGAPA